MFQLENGALQRAQFRMADINKVLLSAKDVANMGYRIVLDNDGSGLVHKSTGSMVPLHEQNKVYGIKVRVYPDAKLRPLMERLHSLQRQPFPRHAFSL